MMDGLPFDIVELVPCPEPARSVGDADVRLREVAFRSDAWLPDELDILRARFATDDDLQAIADGLGRPLAGVRCKLAELGLRRTSNRPWTGMERAYLAQHYGVDATSSIAAALGRTPAAIYAQAGVDGLREQAAPDYTPWEIAQVKAGYAQGVPVAQLAVLVGRPMSGVACLASRLGITHANSPPDWTTAEQQRALAMAEEGRRYRQIAAALAAEGFPPREHGAVGQALRKLGHGRGWGRPWLDEEKALLRQAYERGDSLTPLRERLGRSRTSITYQAGEMGLQGTHIRPHGWRTEPDWTDADVAILRRDYGRVKTAELARALGRPKAGVFNKAWSLRLRHGFIRAFTEQEKQAIRLARAHGVSLTDLSRALGRDVAVVGKHAARMSIPFSTRAVMAPRTRRAERAQWTLAGILALADRPAPAGKGPVPVPTVPLLPAEPAPIPVALPGVPPMRTEVLAATHIAGLLVTVGRSAAVILVGPAPG